MILQPTFLFLTYLNLKITSISSNPYHLIQASTPPPQNFFSFGPWLDTLKLQRNSKFQVLGSSETLLFQFLANNRRNWTLKALEAEESKNLT